MSIMSLLPFPGLSRRLQTLLIRNNTLSPAAEHSSYKGCQSILFLFGFLPLDSQADFVRLQDPDTSASQSLA